MTILIVCLLITIVLPYLVKLPVGYAMQKTKGGYNNNYPREQQASLHGFGARAVGAHQNCFESLAVFSTAALTALVTNHVSSTIQVFAVVYVISRLVYVLFYFMNLAALRSIAWFVGFICCVSIILMCIS